MKWFGTIVLGGIGAILGYGVLLGLADPEGTLRTDPVFRWFLAFFGIGLVAAVTYLTRRRGR